MPPSDTPTGQPVEPPHEPTPAFIASRKTRRYVAPFFIALFLSLLGAIALVHLVLTIEEKQTWTPLSRSDALLSEPTASSQWAPHPRSYAIPPKAIASSDMLKEERTEEIERQRAVKARHEEAAELASPEYAMRVMASQKREEERLAKQKAIDEENEKMKSNREEEERFKRREAVDNGVKDMAGRIYCAIPKGNFQMGSLQEKDAPPRTVNVEAFYIAQTEVTYKEWKTISDWAREHGYQIENEGQGLSPWHPVTKVSCFDAMRWCNAKSEQEGLTPCYYLGETFEKRAVFGKGVGMVSHLNVKPDANGYQLPTEEQWEKAARGGLVDQLYPNGNTLRKEDANFENTGTTQVMTHTPNGYGLYDMAGNVWEWCWNARNDESQEEPKSILRGGGWELNTSGCRVSFKFAAEPNTKTDDRGFRLVRRFEPSPQK